MLNSELRKKIVEIITQAKEGHIPSSFSIVDVVNYLYENILKYDPKNPKDPNRDYFVLSKGHGCAGFYVVLHKFGILSDKDLQGYSQRGGILGGHPDTTKVPGAEASTGSLGHGFPTAMGVALGLKVQKKMNRVFCLMGDGECNEGTIWETALVAAHQKLGNLVAIVDFNGSSDQILPISPLAEKWKAFGWNVLEINGHSESEMEQAFSSISYELEGRPTVIITKTVKGKGVSFVEGHGKWHHRIPNEEEYQSIMQELS